MSSNIEIKPIEDLSVKEEFKFKVVIVGDSGVGKTNLVKRFVTDSFNKDSKATVGVEFMCKNYSINGKIFKIEMWDTAGQERYKSITAAYYKGAKGAMIVYDVTNKESFDNVDKWHNEIKEKAAKTINIMMIGNKTDLVDNIQVTSDMSKSKATALEIPVMETSALDASNVKEAFYQLLGEMYKSVSGITEGEGNNAEKVSGGVALDTNKGEKNSTCC